MTDSELEPLRSLLSELAPQGRRGLLPALHAAQQIYGCLAEPVVAVVAHALGVPLADVDGVIDFYAMFQRRLAGRSPGRGCTARGWAPSRAAAVGQEQWRGL